MPSSCLAAALMAWPRPTVSLPVLGARGEGLRHGGSARVCPKTPIVPAAILYDLANGGDKDWAGIRRLITALGRAAYRSSWQRRSKSAAPGPAMAPGPDKVRGGLGSASIITDDGLRVGALAAVNSFGSVYMPGTRRLLGLAV